ncbi:MAG: hypothetical protein U1C74_28745 [Phenylobacterium sp.]|nr:hypothetical protein [Phenylobacterium sp.]
MPDIGREREWRFGARVDAAYDTNISRSTRALSVLRGIEQEDYLLTPSLTAVVVQPIGRQAVFLNADAGYTFYRRNSQLDKRRAAISGGVSSTLGPCQQVTYAGYDASQSDLANLDQASSVNLRQTTSIAAGLQCSRPGGLGGSLFVQRADKKNSNVTLKESDATTETASATVMYEQPTLGGLVLAFNYSGTEFPNRINPGRPVGDGLFVQSYTLGYNRAFGRRGTVSASAGVNHVKREFAPPGVDQSFNSTAYQLDVLYGLGERIDLELHAAQSVTPSQQVGKSFDKRTSGEAVIRYRLGPRISVTAGYARQDIDSNADTASALVTITSAQIDSVYGAVEYTPNDRMTFRLNVRHDERDANLPQFNYSAMRIGLSAQANF